MATRLNKAGERFAASLIKAGHYDLDSSWSFSPEDGDKLLGPNGDDWMNYAKWHLGEDPEATKDTKEQWKYPFGKGGKVFKHALDAIDGRATQNGDAEIDDAVHRLKDMIAAEEKKKNEEHAIAAIAKRDIGRGAALGAAIMAATKDGRLAADDPLARTPLRELFSVASIMRLAAADVISDRPKADGREIRHLALRMEPATVDPAARTVDLTVSTGAKVRRFDWWEGREYDEALMIAPDAIRMDRLNNGAPVCDVHDIYTGVDKVLGVIVPGTARIEDGELRATAKFSENPAGDAAFRDVQAGVLRNCSVGYLTHKQEIDETQSPPVYTATDWEPHEVSMVPVGADPGAGVRSLVPPPGNARQPHERTVMTDKTPADKAAETAAAEERKRITTEAQQAERTRVAGIHSLAGRFKLEADFVKKRVDDGTSLDAFRAEVLDQIPAESADTTRALPPNPAVTAPSVRSEATREKDKPLVKGQMAARLFRLMAASKGDPDRAIKIARLPAWQDAHTETCVRALIAGSGGGGGFLIPEEYSQEVIELLRPRAVVRALGARQIPMPGGNLNMPRLQGGATAAYVGEAAPPNASQQTFGNVKLSEKKLMALVPVSNDLIKFASPQADQVVLDDMIAQIAVAEDSAFIRGTGTQFSPKGMRNWAVSGNVTGSAGASLANVTTDLLTAMNALQLANVRMLQPGWMMSPRSANAIAALQSTTGQFVYRDEMAKGTLWGYPFKTTTNIPTNLGGGSQSELYLVDFADAVIGDVPGIEIEVSREAAYVDNSGTMQAAFSQDVTVIRAIERHDFVMRHDASVAVITGVTY